MVIKRKLTDIIITLEKEVVIELTPDEIREAYYEYEHQCDVEDINDELDSEDFFDDYGVPAVQLTTYVEELATEKRRLIEEYDYEWSEAVREAIREKVKSLKGVI